MKSQKDPQCDYGVSVVGGENARYVEWRMQPSPNGSHGRDSDGRFGTGNRGGPGNPHAAQVSRLRSAMLAEVRPEDMRKIIRRLIELAKEGNVQAIREVLLRTVGKPVEHDLLDRLEALECKAGEISL